MCILSCCRKQKNVTLQKNTKRKLTIMTNKNLFGFDLLAPELYI